MKRFLSVLILAFLYSCSARPVEILRLVNDQNDGWNAFTVSLFNDSTYKKEEFLSSAGGDYSVINDTVYFTTGALEKQTLVFGKDSLGCNGEPKLVFQRYTTVVRVIFDSLFCGRKISRP